MNSPSRTLFRYWLPALLWTAVVLTFSFDLFSAEHTGAVLALLLHWTLGPLSPRAFDRLHELVRKGAHVTEYGILALLYFRAWRGGEAGWRLGWARQALAVTMAVAGVDEFHQHFAPSRGSSALDVLLDSVAGALCLLLLFMLWRKRQAVANLAPLAHAGPPGER